MTVNLIMKGIPTFEPTIKYGHGDLFYLPEQDMVCMVDEYLGGFRYVYGEVKHDCPQTTYLIRRRGFGKGVSITESMPIGWNRIKKVIFNDPATIVFWQDGTKTKAFGNLGNYYNQIKKWLPEEKEEETNP